MAQSTKYCQRGDTSKYTAQVVWTETHFLSRCRQCTSSCRASICSAVNLVPDHRRESKNWLIPHLLCSVDKPVLFGCADGELSPIQASIYRGDMNAGLNLKNCSTMWALPLLESEASRRRDGSVRMLRHAISLA